MLRFILFGILIVQLIPIRIMAESKPADMQSLAGKRIMWLGDSITQQGDYVSFVEYYLQKQNPTLQYDIYSIGLASETASGLSEKEHPFLRPCVFSRIDQAIERIKPQVIVASYGMNDGIYHPPDADIFKAYQVGIKKLIDKAKQSSASIILLTPTPFETLPKHQFQPIGAPDYGYRHPYEKYDEVLAEFSKWEATQAGKDVTIIDLHSSISEYAQSMKKTNPKFVFTSDCIHPRPEGHLKIAEIIILSLGGKISDEELKTQFDEISKDPLFSLVKNHREIRSHGWLPYIGYVRDGTHKIDEIATTESAATEIQKKIDALKMSEMK